MFYISEIQYTAPAEYKTGIARSDLYNFTKTQNML